MTATTATTPTTAGKFSIDAQGVLSGPAEYMKDKGNVLIDAILDGKDTIFNMTCHYSPNIEIAICVRLQTDYAGWIGMRQFEAAMSAGK